MLQGFSEIGHIDAVAFSSFFPAVREELIDLRYRRSRQPGENILEVFEGIDVQSVASLNESHVSRCGLPAFDGGGKQPVAASDSYRLHAGLHYVVVDLQVAVLNEQTERIPSVETVFNRFAECRLGKRQRSLLIEPVFECHQLWLGEALPERFSLFLWNICRQPSNAGSSIRCSTAVSLPA